MDPQNFRENSAKIAADPAKLGSAEASWAHVRDNSAEEARKDGLRFAAPNFAVTLCGKKQGSARQSRAERRAANKAAWAKLSAQSCGDVHARNAAWKERRLRNGGDGAAQDPMARPPHGSLPDRRIAGLRSRIAELERELGTGRYVVYRTQKERALAAHRERLAALEAAAHG